ncbi:MAG: dienelactone hydrolase family protein, partial [Planctomycetota bacterium]
MSTHDFEYECAGTNARGLLALPEVREGEEELAPPYPGVVVCHAWKGPGSFERERAEELAEMGFAVLVADVYGGDRAKDNDEAAALMNPLMEDRGGVLKDRLHASVAALQSHELVDASRCAAIGYCFGGLCVLDLARSGADLRAVVSFHGLLAGHEFGATPVASVLACHGW